MTLNSVNSVRQLLVLTCAVSPPGTPRLVRSDQDLRRQDYLGSARKWARILEGMNVDVLILENTGQCVEFMVKEFRAFGVECNTLQYVEEINMQMRGKGNAEAAMFDRLSEFLRSRMTTYDFVYKVTGRLVVTNFASICLHAPADQPAVCARIRFDRTQVDTRFFGATPDVFHTYFTGLGGKVLEDEGIYLEHVVALAVAKAIFGKTRWFPFRHYPRLAGISASTGVAYGGRRELVMGWLSSTFGRILYNHHI